jgi:hypothetical protein
MKRHWPNPTSVMGMPLPATGVDAMRARELESCSFPSAMVFGLLRGMLAKVTASAISSTS